MDAAVILGCHGHKIYGLTMCEGTQNIIVDLRNISDSYEEVYGYLDAHCKLFDRIITDLNKIGNTISWLQQKGAIPKHTVEAIWDYIAMHKKCGMYMYIQPFLE